MVFFDSARTDSARFSLLSVCPQEVISGQSEADWVRLRGKIAACEQPGEGGFPRGMAAGYVEYDGQFTFGIYHELLVFKHATQEWERVGTANWSLFLEQEHPKSLGESPPSPSLQFAPTISRGDFCRMVERAREYIAAGDIYQVNLSQQFTAPLTGEPWAFYESLRNCSASPHASYLDLGGKTLLSSSPELFLQMSGRIIVTKPIKGTRPRFAETLADEASARELSASAKEIAELVMITDLERNDLGRSCEFGSVSVTELLKLERYAQVFHLVSTIQGRLRPEVDHIAALRACFPGGSITGAPKKRAMEIIAELEPVGRGVYTGALGYFGFNGESQFSIAIRTVAIEGDRAHFHVGAGIVADSDPEREYEETLHKAAGIFLAAKKR